MSFDTIFTTDLGDRLGTVVDPERFPDTDTVSTLVDELRTFVDGLDAVSLATLDIVVADGIDLDGEVDDDGSAIPGGALLALAAAAGQPVSSVLGQVESSYQVALAEQDSEQADV